MGPGQGHSGWVRNYIEPSEDPNVSKTANGLIWHRRSESSRRAEKHYVLPFNFPGYDSRQRHVDVAQAGQAPTLKARDTPVDPAGDSDI